MRNAIRIIVAAVVGYVGFELVGGYLRHRQTSGGPAARGETPVPAATTSPVRPATQSKSERAAAIEPTGHVGGAAMTGGGEGVRAEYGADDDGAGTATRVGRGVVKKNDKPQA